MTAVNNSLRCHFKSPHKCSTGARCGYGGSLDKSTITLSSFSQHFAAICAVLIEVLSFWQIPLRLWNKGIKMITWLTFVIKITAGTWYVAQLPEASIMYLWCPGFKSGIGALSHPCLSLPLSTVSNKAKMLKKKNNDKENNKNNMTAGYKFSFWSSQKEQSLPVAAKRGHHLGSKIWKSSSWL